MIREIGDQGPSHVMGMVAVKVLHKFPLKSPMPQQTDYVSGGTTSSAGSVGGSSLLGGSTSIHRSTHSGGAYGGWVQIISVLIGMTIGGRNLQWCTAHSSCMIGSNGMGISIRI